jgi:hypothetical protein
VAERVLTQRELNRTTLLWRLLLRRELLSPVRASGLWRQDGAPVLEPFASLPREVRRELEDEASRLAAWLG